MPFLQNRSDTFYNKARFIACLWTLLIFTLCFIPGKDIPNVNVPLADKWAHMVLFGVFTLLWHISMPFGGVMFRVLLLLIASYIGWMVEYVQGHYIPDRSQDNMDTLADIIGAAAGILTYYIIPSHAKADI